MKFQWFFAVLSFLRGVIRRLVGGWSLERKSLLFLGVALVLPIGLASWFVLQVVADGLVMQITRQAARDYARASIAWWHVSSIQPASVFPGPGAATRFSDKEMFAALRVHLVDNPEYDARFLMLDEEVEYVDLPNAGLPNFDREANSLRELEDAYRLQLEELAREKEKLALAMSPGESEETPPPTVLVDVEEQAQLVRQIEDSLESTYRELDGPFFPEPTPLTPASDSIQNASPSTPPTPDEGWYVYYHAINFPETCLNCHRKFQASDAPEIPFRAVRVMIPFRQTQVASTTTLAIMIAIAMVTVAATLLVVHWVLRRLVLNPLQHLHSVSDEVSRGNIALRANIDTGDEFNELADAFNRMLRHMTEGQEELKNLNTELDLRVDQLAQANLHLYEANRLKSDFLANMSHELRTPLNSIIGFSDVLRDISSLTDKQRRFAENIQTSGKLLLELINDILDLAKVEAGKMEVAASSFELNELISAQCDLLQTLVDEKNVDLKAEFGENLPPVFQDRGKLQQILTNLLSNAIKFTPDGGLIQVTADMLSATHFQISVADTGVGIPESDFEVIFEKFRQSNAVLQNDGLTRQYAGTGLGLSIVKELCKLLGGEVQLTSRLGTGSTFRVILPVQYDPDATVEPATQGV